MTARSFAASSTAISRYGPGLCKRHKPPAFVTQFARMRRIAGQCALRANVKFRRGGAHVSLIRKALAVCDEGHCVVIARSLGLTRAGRDGNNDVSMSIARRRNDSEGVSSDPANSVQDAMLSFHANCYGSNH
jgi:hypothetical protein